MPGAAPPFPPAPTRGPRLVWPGQTRMARGACRGEDRPLLEVHLDWRAAYLVRVLLDEVVARFPWGEGQEGRFGVRVYGVDGTVSTEQVAVAARERSGEGCAFGSVQEAP